MGLNLTANRAREHYKRLRADGFTNVGTPYSLLKDGHKWFFRPDMRAAITVHLHDTGDNFSVYVLTGYKDKLHLKSIGGYITDIADAIQTAKEWNQWDSESDIDIHGST